MRRFTIAVALGAASISAQAVELMDWSPRSTGAGVSIDGYLDGSARKIAAVVHCDGRYIGNASAYVDPNGTFSWVVLTPGGCEGTIRISRVMADGNPVSLPGQAPEANPQLRLRGDATDPAYRDLDRAGIVAIQKYLGVEPDGVIGPRTLEKVASFNRANLIDHDLISQYLINVAQPADQGTTPSLSGQQWEQCAMNYAISKQRECSREGASTMGCWGSMGVWGHLGIECGAASPNTSEDFWDNLFEALEEAGYK